MVSPREQGHQVNCELCPWNSVWAVNRRIIRIGCLFGRIVGVVYGIALMLFVDFSIFVQLLPDIG